MGVSRTDPEHAGRMPERLSSTGLDTAPRPTDGLFFALLPDTARAVRIAQLAQQWRDEHGLKGKPLATERFHVTLHHLGNHRGLPQDIVMRAGKAAAAVVVAPFELGFDRTLSFLGRAGNRPFVLVGGDGLVALTAFEQVLGVALEKGGFGYRAKPRYTPHVTLQYDERSIAEQTVETVAWTAHEFVLVHSLIGKNRHVVLARWPLR